MSGFEKWTIAVGCAGVVVNFILFVVFSLQLKALRQQVAVSERVERSAEDRARRQATVEFYAATHSRRIDFARRLEDWTDIDTPEEISLAARTDDRLRRAVNDYLNYYEFLALGVNMATYDYDTIRGLARGRMVYLADSYRDYIERARQRNNNAGLWVELEILADRLRREPVDRAID